MTHYKWRSRYGRMDASKLRRMKKLEAELSRYKRMYAEKILCAEDEGGKSPAANTGDSRKTVRS